MTSILVTGGCGFVGHHVVEGILRETDWDIVVLDRLDTSGNPARLTDIDCWENEKRRVRFLWWDLKAEVNADIAREIGAVSYVYHLAAGSHVDRSISDPLSFVMDNVVGTCNLLNWARQNDALELFVNFSTDEVFGTVLTGSSSEYDHHHPKNPYSASKSGQEALGEAFANCYGLPLITTHTMNVFGERQHYEKFVPLVVRKALAGESVTIHADPSKTSAGIRAYIHARNVWSALHFLTRREYHGYDEWNVVGEREIDNLTLAQMIAEIVGKPLRYEMVDFHSSRPGHDLRYALDGSKLADAGWQPPRTFESSLTKTVEWSLANRRWLGL